MQTNFSYSPHSRIQILATIGVLPYCKKTFTAHATKAFAPNRAVRGPQRSEEAEAGFTPAGAAGS